MAYAIVCTTEYPLSYWTWDENNDPIYIETIAAPGTIINIIDYDGTSPYEAPVNTELKEVPDSAEIGDTGY